MSSSDQSHILNELAFHILRSSDKDESVSFSTLSVLEALNVAIHATCSEKLVEQIGQLLQFNANEKKMKQEEKFKLISNLIESVKHGDPEFITFHMENGICASSSTVLENTSALHNVKVCKDDASIKKINDELAKMTGNKLKNILNDHNKPKTGLTFFNAMHLKGAFCNIFRPDSTEVGDFHINSSKTIKISMLKSGGMLMFNEDKDVGARIMYHSFLGCNYSVLVIVPSKKFGLAEMERKLTAEKYKHLVENMRSVLGSLTIPKLSLNKVTDLSSSLKKSGLTELFDPSSANLKKITNSKVSVEHFTQGVSISLNEFGSNEPKRELRESEMYGMCVGGFTSPPEEQNIIANEPFLLIINYHKGNSIVSLHRVIEPVPSE